MLRFCQRRVILYQCTKQASAIQALAGSQAAFAGRDSAEPPSLKDGAEINLHQKRQDSDKFRQPVLQRKVPVCVQKQPTIEGHRIKTVGLLLLVLTKNPAAETHSDCADPIEGAHKFLIPEWGQMCPTTIRSICVYIYMYTNNKT